MDAILQHVEAENARKREELDALREELRLLTELRHRRIAAKHLRGIPARHNAAAIRALEARVS